MPHHVSNQPQQSSSGGSTSSLSSARPLSHQTLSDTVALHDVGRSMAVLVGGTHKCRQPFPTSLFYHHVQRFRMVIAASNPWHLVIWHLINSSANLTAPRSDYINPIDLCNRLNTYIVPEAAVHAFLTALFLINGYWIALVLNIPLLAYNAKKYGPIIRYTRFWRSLT